MKLPINPSQGIRVMMKALQSATKKIVSSVFIVSLT